MWRRWRLAALLSLARAGLTPFSEDPVLEGVRRFQRDIYIPEYYLEEVGSRCSSLEGRACPALQELVEPEGQQGIFSIFGSLQGDPGFFVQDEVAAYFGNGAEDEEADVPISPAGHVTLAPTAARCVRVGFDHLSPSLLRLPQTLQVTPSLQMEVVGTFAVVTSQRQEGPLPQQPFSFWKEDVRVHVEVQDPIAYLRFGPAPVIVEQIWLSHDVPREGHSAVPVILRGRRDTDELWSVYLRYVDFLRPGWLSPMGISPMPVSEIVVLGGQGLRIASIYLSVPSPGSVESGMDQQADAMLRAQPLPAARQGYLLTPAGQMLSLHDLLIGKLALPTAASAYSLEEIQRTGKLRLRPDFVADLTSVAAVAAAAAAEATSASAPTAEELLRQEAELRALQESRFTDSRTVAGIKALLDALLTGAMKFPQDLSLELLEADVQQYGLTYDEVTLEEAANARGFDELYERLFTANRMDTLDLLFTRFLWANHSELLAAPGGVVPEGGGVSPAAKLPAASGAAADGRHPVNSPLLDPGPKGLRRRAVIANLRRHTAIYSRWREPIEVKLALVNSTGAADVSFHLYQNLSQLGVDYYNAASGRSSQIELNVPDAEYFLAELLGLEGQLLIDHRGNPLSEDRALQEHASRTFIQQFSEILVELQRSTAEEPEPVSPRAAPAAEAGDGGLQVLVEQPLGAEEVTWNTPPASLVLAVSCFVVGTVLAVALAPAPERWPGARVVAAIWAAASPLVRCWARLLAWLPAPGGRWQRQQQPPEPPQDQAPEQTTQAQPPEKEHTPTQQLHHAGQQQQQSQIQGHQFEEDSHHLPQNMPLLPPPSGPTPVSPSLAEIAETATATTTASRSFRDVQREREGG